METFTTFYEKYYKINSYHDYFNPLYKIFFEHAPKEVLDELDKQMPNKEYMEVIKTNIRNELIPKLNFGKDEIYETGEFQEALEWTPLKVFVGLWFDYICGEYPLQFMDEYIVHNAEQIFKYGETRDFIPIAMKFVFNQQEQEKENFIDTYKDTIIDCLTMYLLSIPYDNKFEDVCDKYDEEEFNWLINYFTRKTMYDGRKIRTIRNKLKLNRLYSCTPKVYNLFITDIDYYNPNAFNTVVGVINTDVYHHPIVQKENHFANILSQFRAYDYDFDERVVEIKKQLDNGIVQYQETTNENNNDVVHDEISEDK